MITYEGNKMRMSTAQLSSFLKLSRAKNLIEFEEHAATEIHKDHDMHPELRELISQTFLSASFLRTDLIIEFVLKTGDRDCYEQFRKSPHFRHNLQNLSTLYKAEVPDEKIEACLLEILYQRFKAEEWVWTIEIIRTIGSKGSMQTLPMLEVLLYDFYPEMQVAKMKSTFRSNSGPVANKTQFDFHSYANKITNDVILKVYKVLEDAINDVRQRNYQPEYIWHDDVSGSTS